MVRPAGCLSSSGAHRRESWRATRRSTQGGNAIRTDQYSGSLLVRQFFPTPDDVTPMSLRLENLTNPGPARTLTLTDSVIRLDAAATRFAVMVPLMQSELPAKSEAKNVFETDIGSPTSNFGGVPGGNAVTARWSLDPDEALVVRVTPPATCAYWDVQVGNAWYESFDYRTHFSGLTCEQAHLGADGSVTLVVSQDDPGTVNWLESVDHREGHIAIRWQLSDGDLPLPACTVMPTESVRSATGLPPVDVGERAAARALLRHSFDARFGL